MTPAMRAVMRKEFRQLTRDRRMLPLLILAPVVQLTVLGFAVNMEVDRVETVVCDQDRSAASRALARRFLADTTFTEAEAACDPRDPAAPIRSGQASVVLIFPAGLERDLASDRSVEVQVLVDGTDPVVGQQASAAAGAILADAASRRISATVERLEALQGVTVRLPSIGMEPRIRYNQRLVTAVFMVPGVFAMVLLLVTTIATSMGLSREREMGTLEQVMVTPIRPAELILGKVLPFVIIGLLDVLFALVVSAWVFDVPIRGSLWHLALGTLLYLLATVGVGLLISTLSSSQQQAFMGGIFFMMPAVLLSGFATPVENMPDWLQPVTYLNPLRYFLEILRGVLLRASTVQDLWGSYVGLAVLGTTILTLASLRFRKRLG